MLGFMPQELVGSSMYEFYHRDDVPRLAEDHKAGKACLFVAQSVWLY